MIDEFCIFNKGGAVLWSRKLNPTKGEPVDELIQNVLLEEVRRDSFCARSEPRVHVTILARKDDMHDRTAEHVS